MSTIATTDTDRHELDLLIRGIQVSRILGLVADLNVADKVPRNGAVKVHDLAMACAVHVEPLLRILRGLAAFNIFQLSPDGAVSHTSRSLLLRTDVADSRHHAALFWNGRGLWETYGKLDVAMTGGIPHEAAWEMNRFAYLRQHPDEARIFDAHMTTFPDRLPAIATAYDFSRAKVIADIGGGNGGLLREILSRFSAPRGIVFDRKDVIESLTSEHLLQGRISGQSGSFFDHVPDGADLFILNWILHDWSDEDCIRILRTCRKAMGPHSRLLIGEDILEVDPARAAAMAYLDIQMMAMFGSARIRSEQEFRNLLDESGFSTLRIIPTSAQISLIEAVIKTDA